MTERPLRIAHVLDAPFAMEEANGVSQVVRCLARAQAGLGDSVAVFSGVDGSHFADRTVAAKPSVSDILAWAPDVLHFHSVHVPQHVTVAARARRSGIPYCVTAHGGLFPAAIRRGRLKKAVFNALFEGRFLREAHFLHAVSPHEVSAIRGYGYEGEIVVVPNGLPCDIAIAADPEPFYAMYPHLKLQRIFIFIGRLDPWQKGLDLLIDGFSRAAVPDAALVIVGPDERGSRRVLERRAARLGVLSRVIFTGAAFGEERDRLFAAADMFVHTSRWEGLSLSVLAAATAGKPSLVTHQADPLGSLERAGAAVIVEPTVASVASGLTRAASLSAPDRTTMGMRARQVARQHVTWPEIAERLGCAYRAAAGLTRSKAAS